MTSSARARIDGGTVRPRALAVWRLTTSSNVVGCCTGRSAGLAPVEDLSDVNANLANGSRAARSVADQAPDRNELTPVIDRRNGMA